MRNVPFSLKALCVLSLLCALCVSCKESKAEGEYDNWQERNQQYVDSIANLAKQGIDGWTRTLGYYYQQAYADANPFDNNIYIYTQKKENGSGTLKPVFTDSVRVHYRGRLIPSANHPEGYIFSQTYTTNTIQTATAVPALMGMSQNGVGFCTALQDMVEGDAVHIVVPYPLGYGTSTNSTGTVPAYSTLIFDTKLVKVYRYKIDTDTRWR
jgi:FKBP-type peptidyl-prolyl cis-trans isomerase FklB